MGAVVGHDRGLGLRVFLFDGADLVPFGMFTAENTKSTSLTTSSTSATFLTTMCLTNSGIGVSIFQRLPMASS